MGRIKVQGVRREGSLLMPCQGHNKAVLEHAKLSKMVKQVFTLDPAFSVSDLDSPKLPRMNVRTDLVPKCSKVIYHSRDPLACEAPCNGTIQSKAREGHSWRDNPQETNGSALTGVLQAFP